jgi:hypothetical protein
MIEVDVHDAEAAQLAGPHPGVDQQPDNRGVAAVLERVAPARGKKRRERSVAEDRHRLLRDRRRRHPLHRRTRDLPLVGQPPEQLLQRPIVLGDRRRRQATIPHPRQVLLDMLTGDRPDRDRHAGGGKIGRERLTDDQIIGDGRRRAAPSSQRDPPVAEYERCAGR